MPGDVVSVEHGASVTLNFNCTLPSLASCTQPSGLRTVNFRQNLLTDVSAWRSCSSRGVQEDIEFRDNQLKEVRAKTESLLWKSS